MPFSAVVDGASFYGMCIAGLPCRALWTCSARREMTKQASACIEAVAMTTRLPGTDGGLRSRAYRAHSRAL